MFSLAFGFCQKCDTPDFSNDDMVFFRSHVSQIDNFTQNFTSPPPYDLIPIFFTVFRDDDGIEGHISQSEIDNYIVHLNTASHFSDIGLSFTQCGTTQYIDNSILHDGPQLDVGYYRAYSWVGPALNIYLHKSGTAATYPCNINDGNPGQNDCSDPMGSADNVILLHSNIGFPSYNTCAHELGHSLGLIHTHHGDITEADPYNQNGNPRELVLRTADNTKLYQTPNCMDAGDLVCDTGTDCIDPDCQIETMYCTYQGTYMDLNGDEIDPDDYPMANVMSYHGSCNIGEFTMGQDMRMLYYYENYRALQYDDTYCSSLMDFVEFENTDSGMENVSIWFNFWGADYNECFATSNLEGYFQGAVTGSLVGTFIRKADKGQHINDFPLTYDWVDWLSGITVYDMFLIQKHILELDLLPTGYNQIAADVDRNGNITTFDLVSIKKLLLMKTVAFPELESPWMFIPEYIPSDFSSGFNDNPFTIDVSPLYPGADYPGYLEPFWTYEIFDGTDGNNGFDGIKAGDVNGSSEPGILGNDDCEQNLTLDTPNIGISQGETLEIDILANQFNNIAALQMGFKISKEHFNFISIENINLPIINTWNSNDFGNFSDGKLNVAWYNEGGLGTTRADNTPLFTITLEAKQTITNMDSLFYLDENILAAALYSTSGCTGAVEFTTAGTVQARGSKNDDEIIGDEVILYPNPFVESMSLLFSLNRAQKGVIEIRNSMGEIVDVIKCDFEKGTNFIELDKSINFSNGVFFVTIKAKDKNYFKKVLKQNLD